MVQRIMSLRGELQIYNANEMKEKREIREGGVRRGGGTGWGWGWMSETWVENL